MSNTCLLTLAATPLFYFSFTILGFITRLVPCNIYTTPYTHTRVRHIPKCTHIHMRLLAQSNNWLIFASRRATVSKFCVLQIKVHHCNTHGFGVSLIVVTATCSLTCASSPGAAALACDNFVTGNQKSDMTILFLPSRTMIHTISTATAGIHSIVHVLAIFCASHFAKCKKFPAECFFHLHSLTCNFPLDARNHSIAMKWKLASS